MMEKRTVFLRMIICLILIVTFQSVEAQFLTLPQVSPKASVTQRIGITDVTITYHRPGVKERTIWGELVPYGMDSHPMINDGKPFPWRAGANENTVITFATMSGSMEIPFRQVPMASISSLTKTNGHSSSIRVIRPSAASFTKRKRTPFASRSHRPRHRF